MKITAALAVTMCVAAGASSARAQNVPSGAVGNVGEYGEIFGIGTMTCGQWLSSQEIKQRGDDWILGWWTASAADDSKSKLPANKATETRILKESADLCRNKPEAALTNIIAETYFRLEHGKRRR